MKIIFVETPSPWLVRRNLYVPLGPLYLATILKREGYDVRIARPERIEDIFQDTDIVCMSGTTLEYPMNVEYATWIKKCRSSIKIFIGGHHATAMYQEIADTNLFDAICVGEGESVILDMVKDVERDELKSIYFSNGFVKDLDTIPFPDRRLIEGDYGKDIFIDKRNYTNGGGENLMTSRGCSFNCVFCAAQSMWKSKVRYRSTENVISEIKQIIESAGIKQFVMWDDNLTLNKKRCLKLCSAFKELDIIWRCFVRADQLDSEICKALMSAGCKEVWPGIESGDQRVLDYLNKREDTEKMLEGCKNAKRVGLKIKMLLLIGTPGERIDTPELNRDYIDRFDFDGISLSTFIPLPGSPVWNNPERYNCEILSKDFKKYNKDYWVMKNGKKIKNKYEPLIHNKFLTIEQMKDNVERMNAYVEETGRQTGG